MQFDIDIDECWLNYAKLRIFVFEQNECELFLDLNPENVDIFVKWQNGFDVTIIFQDHNNIAEIAASSKNR